MAIPHFCCLAEEIGLLQVEDKLQRGECNAEEATDQWLNAREVSRSTLFTRFLLPSLVYLQVDPALSSRGLEQAQLLADHIVPQLRRQPVPHDKSPELLKIPRLFH